MAFACSDNDANQFTDTYPSTLVSTNYKITGGVKLYSKYGLITNQSAINNWRNNDDTGYFYWDHYDTVSWGLGLQVTLLDRDTILYNEGFANEKRIIREEQGYKFFYRKDTISLMFQNSRLSEMAFNIGISKPYHRTVEAPGLPNRITSFSDALIAKGNTKILKFPILAFKITGSPALGGSFYGEKYTRNAFDKNFINLMQDGDTLAIQESVLTFERR